MAARAPSGPDAKEDGGGRNVRDGQYAPAMANFAVRLVHGPGWDSSRRIRGQADWDEHAAFMDGLVNDGFIIGVAQNLDRWGPSQRRTGWKECGGLPDAYQTQVRR